MTSATSLAIGSTVLLSTLAVATALDSFYRVEIRPRPPDPLTAATVTAPRIPSVPTAQPLALRLVDSGGVGIPAREWDADYSHDTRVFREVILQDSPFVDAVAMQGVERDWRTYVQRMRDYGNNGIVVPMFLQLVDFDRIDGATVYAADTRYRARHAAVRQHFGPLFDWASSRGMQVYVSTDMLALTPPLQEYLQRVAPAPNAVGIDVSSPAVWQIYRAAFAELFDALPSIQGVVIRIGEGGPLYNSPSWPYRSEVALRDPISVRAMLDGLLPLFESRGKTLVLRTWSVGVGRLGRLHLDPDVYESVLGGIDSPALIVSTKYTAGDFFSHLPLNPTLGAGRHRRLIELQARPEFEGFGAFPDFLGYEHASALRALTRANPQVAGMLLWTQSGGPLRAGPRSLYPFAGSWTWIDANVFAASRLAADPSVDVDDLARSWVRSTFGDDPRITEAGLRVLQGTRDAVRRGFYILPFARHEVRVSRLELPPLMWVFEWDILAGWHSVLSLVYLASRDDVDNAIAEGQEAANQVRRLHNDFQRAFTDSGGPCSEKCTEALRSLEYQETLFDAFASWRQAFLGYYRWLDTGDLRSWTLWTDGRARFEVAAARHTSGFATDLDFPAFDFRSAHQFIATAKREGWTRWCAEIFLAGAIALLAVGRISLHRRRPTAPTANSIGVVARRVWVASLEPWRLQQEQGHFASSMAVAIGSLALVGFLVESIAGFTSQRLSAGAALVIAAAALTVQGTTLPARHDERDRLLLAGVGSLLPGVIVLLAIVALYGTLGFWLRFWISRPFRVSVLTIGMAQLLWTMFAVLIAPKTERWSYRFGGLLAAAGGALLATTALLPAWVDVLRALNHPLNVAPATETMLIALRAYVGVSLATGKIPWVTAGLLLASGYALTRRRTIASPTLPSR